MRNVGPVSRGWLAEVEVHTLEDLRPGAIVGAPKIMHHIRHTRISLKDVVPTIAHRYLSCVGQELNQFRVRFGVGPPIKVSRDEKHGRIDT